MPFHSEADQSRIIEQENGTPGWLVLTVPQHDVPADELATLGQAFDLWMNDWKTHNTKILAAKCIMVKDDETASLSLIFFPDTGREGLSHSDAYRSLTNHEVYGTAIYGGRARLYGNERRIYDTSNTLDEYDDVSEYEQKEAFLVTHRPLLEALGFRVAENMFAFQ